MNRRRVLITGGTGLLGRALVSAAPAQCEVLATCYRSAPPVEYGRQYCQLDVCDSQTVHRVITEFQPDIVIHTASVGSVDEAQRDPAGVRRVNVEGVRFVSESCARAKAQMIFISSNAVFDGLNSPYDEEDSPCPINRYGQFKAEAEEIVGRVCAGAAIIRPILMYGWPLPGGRSNAVVRWLAELEKGQPVPVANDIRSMPLFVADCAEAVWAAAAGSRTGIYHVAGPDHVDLVTFAREVALAFGCPAELIEPVPSSYFVSLAPRPHDTEFVTTKLRQELGVNPMGIREGLAAMCRMRSLAK